MCFAVGGPLVRIARTYSGVVEVQTAQQWGRVDDAEVERRIATATRGALA